MEVVEKAGLEQAFADIISSESDPEVIGMARFAWRMCKSGNYVAAYWVLHAYSLGSENQASSSGRRVNEKVRRIETKLIPIKQCLYDLS